MIQRFYPISQKEQYRQTAVGEATVVFFFNKRAASQNTKTKLNKLNVEPFGGVRGFLGAQTDAPNRTKNVSVMRIHFF